MNESHRNFLIKDTRSGIWIIAVCSLLGFFQALIPLLDLFNHFRPHAVFGAIFCGAILLFLKDQKLIIWAVVAAVLILNIGALGWSLYQTLGIPSLKEDKPVSVSIVSANVLGANTDYQAVRDMVARENPDVLVFSEVTDAWVENFKFGEQYAYSIKFPRADNFGMAAYSKRPFEGEVKIVTNGKVPMIIMNFNEFTVIGVHPVPPVSISYMSENRSYIEEAAYIGMKSKNPVIVTGDFNATLWSSAMKPLIDAGFDRINPLGFAYTWPRNKPFLALQIDHFMAKNIKAADFGVLPSVGSDHYPIRADIAF